MGERIAGTCYVKVDGDQVKVQGAVEAAASDTTREPVMSTSGVVGFKETAEAPFVKATLVGVKQAVLDKIANAKNQTVTVEFANGDVYTLSDAWVGPRPSHNSDTGTVEVEWNGMRGSWA